MQLVCQVSNKDIKTQDFCTYQYDKGRWKLVERFSVKRQQDLYEHLVAFSKPIDYAILSLNGSFRNTFYACFPSVIIMIAPSVIWQYCGELEPNIPDETYREVAIGIEEKIEKNWYEQVDLFLYYFYHMKTKEEALAYYEKWQLEHILMDPLTKRFIRTMEYFKDEILNYFVLKGFIY